MLAHQALHAQSGQQQGYTVYINLPDASVRAEVQYDSKSVPVKEDLTYAWYSSNKIMETKGGYSGRLLNGAFVSYYLSENLKEKGNYRYGLKHGQWISWYENGKIREISNWFKGMRSGVYRRFDAKGNMIRKSTYRSDLLNGYELEYSESKMVSKRKYSKGVEVLPKIKTKKTKSEKDSASVNGTKKLSFRTIFHRDKKTNDPAPAEKHSSSQEKNKTPGMQPKRRFTWFGKHSPARIKTQNK